MWPSGYAKLSGYTKISQGMPNNFLPRHAKLAAHLGIPILLAIWVCQINLLSGYAKLAGHLGISN
jgi:hypothetical protein